MKIEICESLMLSYIKHVKECMFYQTNWKAPDNKNIDGPAYDRIRKDYERINNKSDFYGILDKSKLNQLIKQTEIDILGINSEGKIYAAETAFHENGLNYKKETRNRIIRKLLRSYLALRVYFPENKQYELLFASPKVKAKNDEEIIQAFDTLNNMFPEENVNFKYISNNLFKREILIPTIEKTKKYSDSNELFIRAVKMLGMFGLIKY